VALFNILPKYGDSRWNFVAMCSRTLYVPGVQYTSSHLPAKRRKQTVAGTSTMCIGYSGGEEVTSDSKLFHIRAPPATRKVRRPTRWCNFEIKWLNAKITGNENVNIIFGTRCKGAHFWYVCRRYTNANTNTSHTVCRESVRHLRKYRTCCQQRWAVFEIRILSTKIL